MTKIYLFFKLIKLTAIRNKKAEKFGYKFNILAGYVFESDYLFNDYIDSLYQMKANGLVCSSIDGIKINLKIIIIIR